MSTHINAQGVKWQLDTGLTEWCTRADQNGISLPGHKVWIVETPEGKKTRLLTDGQDIIAEYTGLEDMAVKIDIIKAQKKYDTRTIGRRNQGARLLAR
jgi:hypothetical protein